MLRKDKEQVVAQLAERLRGSDTLILADYRGLSMSEIDGVRTELLRHGARFSVVKNTLTKRAAEEDPRRKGRHPAGPADDGRAGARPRDAAADRRPPGPGSRGRRRPAERDRRSLRGAAARPRRRHRRPHPAASGRRTKTGGVGMATDTAKLVDQLGKMTVLELVELKSKLEEEWGVTAAAPVAVAAPGAGPAGGDGAAGEEQTAFDVILTE